MKKNESMEKAPIKLHIASFSTDMSIINPFDIFEHYFQKSSTKITHIIKSNSLQFYFSISNVKYLAILYDLRAIHTISKICRHLDLYIVFIDMEVEQSKDNSLQIFQYIINNCPIEKKAYILGCISDGSKEKMIIKENNINELLKDCNLNYEYLELEYKDCADLENCIEYILTDGVDNIKEFEKNRTINIDFNKSLGKSCVII